VRTTFGARLEWNLNGSMQDHGGLAIDVHVLLTTIGGRGKIVYSLQSFNNKYQHLIVIPRQLKVPKRDFKSKF
jgi:hypothetical protein